MTWSHVVRTAVGALALASMLVACAPARNDRPQPPRGDRDAPATTRTEGTMAKSIAGTVSLDGAPLVGVEVVLTDGAGTAVASSSVDAAGRFRFDPDHFDGGWVVARLHEPIVGAAARPVAAGAATVDVALASSAAVTLALTVKPPAGVALDWANVAVNPRALPGVPDAVVAAAKLVGIGPSIRGSYHEVRITGPRLDLRLLPGTWGLTVEHLVERSPTDEEPPPDWINDTLVLSDGTRIPANLGEHRVVITGDLAATIETRVYDQGVPHGTAR